MLSPGATVLADMLLKVRVEILEGTLQRLHGSRRERTKCVSRSIKLSLKLQLLQVSCLSSALLHCAQNPFCPVEPAPAGSAPAARLLCEEALQVPDHPDRTCLIIQYNHGPCTQPAAHFLHFPKIHAHVQMLLGEEVRRSATGKQTAKLHTIAHPSRMFFQDFADGCTHWQLPQAWAF